jgi:hypothetical protein
MDYNVFRIVGAVAGIGGIALASVVYIFREVIRKEIFPQLTKEQAYTLLNRIVVLIFIIGVLGIIAYIVVNWQSGNHDNTNNTRSEPTPTQTLVTSELSGTVLDQNERPIQGVKVTLDDIPGMLPVETSSDGIFSIINIPRKYSEAVRIRVVKEGYQPNPYTEDVVLGKSPPRVRLQRKK